MKLNYYILLLVTLLTLACNQEPKKEEESCTKPSKKMIDHVPSEMAILMDNMYRVSDSIKQEYKTDSTVVISFNQDNLLKAESVNERVESPEFETMAKTYLSLLKSFNEAKHNRKKKFNNMVDGCMNCHEQICQGPMVRIKKLYIK